MTRIAIILCCWLGGQCLHAQDFYLGVDMSYLQEMEDCGAQYRESGTSKDPYAIFEERGANLVRLRLWHTPSWYDGLNSGKRYGDLADVKKAIRRAKNHHQTILLDFHLSDDWADPAKQLVPAAWASVVDDLALLKDSLYRYVNGVLMELDAEGLLPEMVQIGNETNKGILLSAEDNATWVLEWPRNAALFNEGIKAVRDAEAQSGKQIQVMIHVAGPESTDWLIDEFVQNGVTDFDLIGLSYYWTWHQPDEISDVGRAFQVLKSKYPTKQTMLVETAYPWTDQWADDASNINSSLHQDYAPASPEAQKNWMIDLTSEVKQAGGSGVVYWEPCWISTPCSTQWGRGSHQEHATFFDFEHELISDGGIQWLSHDYEAVASAKSHALDGVHVQTYSSNGLFDITNTAQVNLMLNVRSIIGSKVWQGEISQSKAQIDLRHLPSGVFLLILSHTKMGQSVVRLVKE